jgi:hypothetical protein
MHVSAVFQIFCITLGLISLGQSEVIDISEIPLVETCPPVGLTYLATNTTTLKYFYYSTERVRSLRLNILGSGCISRVTYLDSKSPCTKYLSISS